MFTLGFRINIHWLFYEIVSIWFVSSRCIVAVFSCKILFIASVEVCDAWLRCLPAHLEGILCYRGCLASWYTNEFFRSLALEFDVRANPDIGDPGGNHISVQSRGVDPNSGTVSRPPREFFENDSQFYRDFPLCSSPRLSVPLDEYFSYRFCVWFMCEHSVNDNWLASTVKRTITGCSHVRLETALSLLSFWRDRSWNRGIMESDLASALLCRWNGEPTYLFASGHIHWIEIRHSIIFVHYHILYCQVIHRCNVGSLYLFYCLANLFLISKY